MEIISNYINEGEISQKQIYKFPASKLCTTLHFLKVMTSIAGLHEKSRNKQANYAVPFK